MSPHQVIISVLIFGCAFITQFDETKAILEGEQIDIEQTKYIVSVRHKRRDVALFGNGHICSGVLIADRAILTAAKCVYIDK